MNMITTAESAKFIQSWHSAILPDGYAVVPSELDTTDFYAYNGFVTLSIDVETNTVTKMTPNVEAWEEWKESLSETEGESEDAPEDDYVTWAELSAAIQEGVNSI